MRAGATADGGGTASFEVERLEWVAPNRLEVAGRWFGVRGLRFVRPSLDLEAGDERRHLLAVLDHKPWEAHDGEDWVAAFPWDGEAVELSYAELAVTPGVVVELPVPAGSGTALPARRAVAKTAAPARRVRANRDREDRARAEAQALRQERDTALAAREEALAARDAAAHERDAALRDRDGLARAHDAALNARNAAVADREAAAAARSAALAEVESALVEREVAQRERDAARRALEDRSAERDRIRHALKVARDAGKSAIRERDAAVAERDDLARSSRVATHATPARSAPPAVSVPEQRSQSPLRLVALGALVLLIAIFGALILGLL